MSEYTDTSYEFSSSLASDELASTAGLESIRSGTPFVAVHKLITELRQHLDVAKSGLPQGEHSATAVISHLSAQNAGHPLAVAALGSALTDQGRDASLEQVVGAAERRLLLAEASLLHTRVRDSLVELGYTIRAPRRPLRDQVVLRAEQSNGVAISVEMKPSTGHLSFDLSGFNGNVCQDERKRLLDTLARRGVLLRPVATERHGRREGGSLTRKVASLLEEQPTSTPVVPMRVRV